MEVFARKFIVLPPPVSFASGLVTGVRVRTNYCMCVISTVILCHETIILFVVHTDVRDKDSKTPLHHACTRLRSLGIVCYLVEKGKCDVGELFSFSASYTLEISVT